MKIILAGGSGCIGAALAACYKDKAAEVIILSRRARKAAGNIRYVTWDGKHPGPWVRELEGAEMLVNLTGRSVNCRYHKKNRDEILSSRVDSVKVLGEAVRTLQQPPKLWIQFSSATIYRHAEDRPMDETTGETGEGFSVDVCLAWEKAFREEAVAAVRKVILRTGIVMDLAEGAFPSLMNMVRFGLGGRQGHGRQFVSWIHIDDVTGAIEWIRCNPHARGVYNCTSPNPVQNNLLMRAMRKAVHIPAGLPAPAWLLALGAALIGTETELILKSRWVLPVRLLSEGYRFKYPDIAPALEALAIRSLA